jgi:acyl-CoA synthetase (NDP forming)
MLAARTVAVVGASVKPGSLGEQMMLELERGGYEGAVYPVNPGYDEIGGHRCYPSIGEVPEAVELAILGVANHRVEQALRDAAQAGAKSATTFSSLYEEDPEPGAAPLPSRLATIAEDAGMAFCGGNGMGFLNLEAKLRATGFPTPDEMRSGPVAFVSHSGSAFAAVAFNDRGIGFNLLVSSGQEIVTGVADYIAYALELESTRVIGLFLETIRRPDDFAAVLERAMERAIPVVALKVGRAAGSAAMVAAHSGALAGEDGAYEALFDAYGVHRVRSLDEMADTLELFSAPRRVRSGTGIASLHDSGGERVLLVDLAEDEGVPFAAISGRTRAAIQDALDPGLIAENPLDAWGTGIDHERIFIDCFRALHDDPEVAAIVFSVDLTRQGEPYDEGYLQVARAVWDQTDKPFCVQSNLASAVDLTEAHYLRDAGIPVLEGSESALRALRHLLDERAVRERTDVAPPPAPEAAVRRRWRERVSSGEALDELDGLAMLADYGVPTIAAERVDTRAGAVEAAGRIGYPVALKTAVPGIAHKSDVGGVLLRLPDADAVGTAYDDLASRLGPQVTVAAMAPSGAELALGVVVDPQFGPLVLVAAGGVLVELLKDRRLGLPPLDEAAARRMLDGLRSRALLDGFRGEPAADVDAVARAIAALSVLASDLGDALAALDVNPLIAGPEGCVAVDALVVPRS